MSQVVASQTAELGDWIALLKPRVMTLVVFTGLIGLLIAPGHLNPVLAFTAVPERALNTALNRTHFSILSDLFIDHFP